jgi:ABC-type phosphate transport system substrate-binding protein
MRPLALYATLAFWLGAHGAATPASSGEPLEFRVVVHPSNTLDAMSRQDVADLFLKKVTKWPNGGPVLPVDLGDKSPVREKFSRAVHGKSAAAIAAFWQQQIFSGRGTPPTQKRDDDDVLSHVRANPGAVGYVSAGASLTDVKVVKLAD